MHIVPILASAALVSVVVSWTLDVSYGLRPIGTLPLVYDLSLAFLTAFFFQVLVVWLPERRRHNESVRLVGGNLLMMANNGRDLIRDLEFIARCPEREVTEEHLRLVLTACNNNEAMKRFLRARLSVGRSRYKRVEPFLFALPHEVAVAVQRIDEAFLNQSEEVPYEELHTRAAGDLERIREPVLIHLTVAGGATTVRPRGCQMVCVSG